MKNAIYLRRRNKVLVEGQNRNGVRLPLNHVATMAKNVEALGFALSPPLIEACRLLSTEALAEFYRQLVTDMERAKGAHRRHKPFFPNFPRQVMSLSDGELYFNALLHYWTGGGYRPYTDNDERPALLWDGPVQTIDLGTEAEFETLFGQVAGSNTSLSDQDKEDLAWFAGEYGEAIGLLLPPAIPQKENAACVGALLIRHAPAAAPDFLDRHCRTATDVLRLAAALSDGDVSLAEPTRFRSFPRAERVRLLGLLDRAGSAAEDVRRWPGRWVRLGERLHPGEYAKRFPHAAHAFAVVRDNLPVETFNGELEAALEATEVLRAAERLSTRPGDFARRLDHLLRLAPERERPAVLARFDAVAHQVSTPVLLQVRHHFRTRNAHRPLRVFFPKGNLARSHAEPNRLPPLPPADCEAAARACETTLLERFRALPPLGRVYVDPALADYVVPFSQRSASKALRTVARGSRLPLPPGSDVLRFFVWWKNGRDRTDIDLSAALFGPDFSYADVLSYYNLKNFGGAHSGDVVDAPEGASEFIDVSLAKLAAPGTVRYVVMVLNSYTQQPYIDLPECFAGWMAREESESGEVYEPKTVQDRLDVTADSKIAVPIIIDVQERRVIWADLSLKSTAGLYNNVESNKGGVQVTLRSLTDINKPSLYDLFLLHAQARGELADSPNRADAVFSVAAGTPFRQEEIASGFL